MAGATKLPATAAVDRLSDIMFRRVHSNACLSTWSLQSSSDDNCHRRHTLSGPFNTSDMFNSLSDMNEDKETSRINFPEIKWSEGPNQQGNHETKTVSSSVPQKWCGHTNQPVPHGQPSATHRHF